MYEILAIPSGWYLICAAQFMVFGTISSKPQDSRFWCLITRDKNTAAYQKRTGIDAQATPFYYFPKLLQYIHPTKVKGK